MVLLRHPRPAGFVALLLLGTAVAGPAFARTGLQSEHYVIPPQMAQAESADTADMSVPSFDHGENGADRGTVGHDFGGHDHDHDGHGGGHGRR
ncbi:hypothetical protein QFZ27_002211 [Inquilinus ginsengisoli]|uniref:hypothetical protein n=1 Tax=Inquilinus ginsengisoli TaxID=363840 RepID=UPI003D23FF3E